MLNLSPNVSRALNVAVIIGGATLLLGAFSTGLPLAARGKIPGIGVWIAGLTGAASLTYALDKARTERV